MDPATPHKAHRLQHTVLVAREYELAMDIGERIALANGTIIYKIYINIYISKHLVEIKI